MANYYGASPQAAAYPQQQYGAMVGQQAAWPKPKRPSRMNLAAICTCLFLPWLLFCIMYAVMSFSLHYDEKLLCFLSVLMGFIFVAAIGKLAVDSMKKQSAESKTDPSWFVFLALACLIAWLSGVVLGDLNYFYNLEPYYDINNLNSYPSVDPATTPGQQVMDAGRIAFVSGSRVDFKLAMAFRNLDSYCVAPVVKNQTKPGSVSSYDFWAVGLNCCSGHPGDYTCGESSNPHAASGLRVMRADQRGFYMLAVKQAEAAYNIKANHPLLLYWMQDPVAEIAAYMDDGFKYYLFGVFTFFAWQMFTVIAAVVLFSKM